MRVFKPTYKAKDGKTKRVNKWWVELRDHLSIVRRFPGYAGDRTARTQTEALGNQIQRLVNFKRAGDPPDEKANLWLDQIDRKLRDKLVEFGLVDDRKSYEARPLTEYLPEFQASIKPRKN